MCVKRSTLVKLKIVINFIQDKDPDAFKETLIALDSDALSTGNSSPATALALTSSSLLLY